MILTFPKVNDDGTEIGVEVAFRWQDVIAIEKMTKWDYIVDGEARRGHDVEIPIDGCSTVYLAKDSFDIKKEYSELLEMWKTHHELYE